MIMKITPIAGAGMTAPTQVGPDPVKLERAKLVAAGQTPEEVPRGTGDAQVDRINNRRIKMKTQVSTNRDVEQPVVEEVATAIPDTIEPAQEAEETKPLSPQFAALAKTKRALQVKERELVQREEALKNAPPSGGDEALKAELLANPLKIFELGVTYDQLTEAILNTQSQPIDQQKLRSEIKDELKKELLGEFSTRDQQAEQQVLGDIKREIIQLTAEGDKFEAIREAKAQPDVVALIHRVWQNGWPEQGIEKGTVIDSEFAAEFVENQLIDEALPFARIKKVQSRLTPAQEIQAEKIPAPLKPNTKIMRTLTNRDSASPVLDRRARAIAAMQGTLKRG